VTRMHELYDEIGETYGEYRRADPRIAAHIATALGDARTIVNIGAGTGSYEPKDRNVVAVEPSEIMIRQRASDTAPVVRASAMQLPFQDGTFDAALAIFTVHHWPDQQRGLKEMSRVAALNVILTWDQTHAGAMWLIRDYFPEIGRHGRTICPPLDAFRRVFARVEIVPVSIPQDCTDGFLNAYWRRPEAYFDAGVRSAISAFADLPQLDSGLARLRRDLDDGSWVARNAALLNLTECDLGYRLIIAER